MYEFALVKEIMDETSSSIRRPATPPPHQLRLPSPGSLSTFQTKAIALTLALANLEYVNQLRKPFHYH